MKINLNKDEMINVAVGVARATVPMLAVMALSVIHPSLAVAATTGGAVGVPGQAGAGASDPSGTAIAGWNTVRTGIAAMFGVAGAGGLIYAGATAFTQPNKTEVIRNATGVGVGCLVGAVGSQWGPGAFQSLFGVGGAAGALLH